MPAEREAVRECHQSSRPFNTESGGLRMEVWPIHEPGWKREILFTLPGVTEELSEYEFDHSPR
jgi:hypothetical protein